MNIAKNTESSSIVVQWDEVDDSLPTTYTVTWTSEKDLNNVQVKALEEQSSYTITGLTLDTVYTITVTADNKCDQGPEYSTSVSLTTDTTSSTSTITATTNNVAITSVGSSSTNAAVTRSNTITTTVSIAISTTMTIETTNLMTSSTNPSAVITSANTATDNMFPVSTMNPADTSTADTTTAEENSKILKISICNKQIMSIMYYVGPQKLGRHKLYPTINKF